MNVHRAIRPLLAAAVATALGTAPALADNQKIGLKVTITGVDAALSEVAFDVTAYTRLTSPGSPQPTTTLIGNIDVSQGFSTFNATLLNPTIPGISYGTTTATVATASLPADGAGVFRGSFTHTYPGPGDYTIRVGSFDRNIGYASTGAYTNPSLPLAHGNPMILPAGSPASTTNNGFTTGNTSVTWNYPFILGITATKAVTIPNPVPALPEAWLLIAATLLLGVGAFALRRG